MPLLFAWDPRKERANRRKHRVSFEEASTIFRDTLSITLADDGHSVREERWVTLGRSNRGNLLVVVHTESSTVRLFGLSAPGRQAAPKGTSMKKVPRKSRSEIKPEYDFSKGVRGKYAKRFAEGTNVVVLEPDIMRVFPDSASVNRALRLFVEAAKRTRRA